MIRPVREGMPVHFGFFSHLKQEYVSARLLLYSGLTDSRPHFSDRHTFLFNTLDYPVYALANEKVKTAFRTAYSILDKIGFFLNDYFALGIPENKISFRGLWFDDPRKGRNPNLRAVFKDRRNPPLRGLFWLSRDLYEDSDWFRDALQDDARQLREIRNHLEHKYLKVHQSFSKSLIGTPIFDDHLCSSIDRARFEEMTSGLFKMVRCALIYLCLAVQIEEESKRSKLEQDGTPLPSVHADIWEDDWKF